VLQAVGRLEVVPLVMVDGPVLVQIDGSEHFFIRFWKKRLEFLDKLFILAGASSAGVSACKMRPELGTGGHSRL
jgi:hypothetical protein